MARKNILLKRLALVAFDVAACLILALTTLPVVTNTAWAYVDPSVMTYTIQALAGVAVALSAVLGVAFRRTRKKLVKLLGIDENAGKEIDATWCRIDENGNPVQEEGQPEYEEAKKKALFIKKEKASKAEDKGLKPKWFRRLILSLIVVAFGGFTLGIVAPYEIVAGAGNSLSFTLNDIAVPMAIATAIVVVAVAFVLSLFRGKVFTFLLAIAFAFSLCLYVQAMFLNTGLPIADGREVNFWGDYGNMMIMSAAVWAILIVGLVALSFWNRSRFQFIAAALSIVIIFVQAVGVGSLFANQDSNRSYSDDLGPVQVTEDGMNEVASKNNVIMLVLDNFDIKTMDTVIQQFPDALNEWTGFTYFHNTAGVMIPTNNAIPYLLTGVTPEDGEDLVNYRETRYSRSTYLKELHDSNYSVGIYTPDLQTDHMSENEKKEFIASSTMNIHPLSTMTVNTESAVKELLRCALYRDMPWVAKARFLFYTDDVNKAVVAYTSDGSPADTLHVTDDLRYYQNLQSNPLTIDDRGYNGAYRFIHLNGDHIPYTLNENVEPVPKGQSDELTQARAAIKIVDEYIRQLKELGVYDDATIIITADHGNWHSRATRAEFTYSTNPIMFVKKSGSNSGFVTSDAAVSQSQLQATILAAMGQDYSKYGKSLLEDDPSVDNRTFYMIQSDGHYSYEMWKYLITGEATDFTNWSYTGITLTGGKA